MQGPRPGVPGRALWADPEFRRAIGAGRAGPFTPLGESNRQAGVTAEELAGAGAEVDRLLAEEEGAPADAQRRR